MSDKPGAREQAGAMTDRGGIAGGNGEVEATVQRTRRFQDEQRQRDQQKKQQQQQGGQPQAHQGMQTTDRPQPDQIPGQTIRKPGLESDLQLRPKFEAPDYKGSGKLAGMAAIVTGGDSGIGRAVAVLYAREGADVAVVYLNEHEDAEETKRWVEKEGRQCVLIPGDVKSAAFCEQAVRRAVQAFGKLDILVNNAAFQLHADTIEDISDERFEETLHTNVGGYFYMARAAVPHMRRGASIVNTGSVVGLQGSAKLLDYATTKGAIHAFTMSLASNLLEKGIRVNAVAPGPVWTPLNPADQSEPGKIERFGSKSDFKRPAQPEELSPAYVFLAAPSCASYITGIVLPVTGSVGS